MDKPISLSVKDYTIRKMAVKLMVPESLIDTVVTHQFRSLSEAIKSEGVYSAELAGFGKFLYNKKKAEKRMEKMLSKKKYCEDMLIKENASEKEINKAHLHLSYILPDIEALKIKLDNEYKADL